MVPAVTTTTRPKSFGVSIRQLHPSSSSFTGCRGRRTGTVDCARKSSSRSGPWPPREAKTERVQSG